MSRPTTEEVNFLILRSLISLSFIDGEISRLERAWLKKMIKRHIYDQDKRFILSGDFQNPLTYEMTFRALPNYHSRNLVLGYARHLFAIDECLSVDEKYAYQKLREINDELNVGIDEEQREAAKEIAKSVKKKQLDVEVNSAGRILRRKQPFIYFQNPSMIYFNGIIFDLSNRAALLAFISILVTILLVGGFSLLMISSNINI